MTDVTIPNDEIDHLMSIRNRIAHPERGLPEKVFEFALHIVPMINVDLVVLNDEGDVLWAWRDDAFGEGWHIPGSIVRVGEPIADRIHATATTELSAGVVAEDAPRAILQLFDVRGTFISLVYKCRLISVALVAPAGADSIPKAGDLCWIKGTPERIYPIHACYATVLPVLLEDRPGPPLMLTVNR